jgi:hypothetical protein
MAPVTYTPMDTVATAEEAAKRKAKLEAEAKSWDDLDGTPKTCPRQYKWVLQKKKEILALHSSPTQTDVFSLYVHSSTKRRSRD